MRPSLDREDGALRLPDNTVDDSIAAHARQRYVMRQAHYDQIGTNRRGLVDYGLFRHAARDLDRQVETRVQAAVPDFALEALFSEVRLTGGISFGKRRCVDNVKDVQGRTVCDGEHGGQSTVGVGQGSEAKSIVAKSVVMARRPAITLPVMGFFALRRYRCALPGGGGASSVPLARPARRV